VTIWPHNNPSAAMQLMPDATNRCDDLLFPPLSSLLFSSFPSLEQMEHAAGFAAARQCLDVLVEF